MSARLLVVDDDVAIRTALAADLTLDGYEVVCAADGEEALELFGRLAPDLVLTDLAMPRLDGLALVRALRRRSGLPIVVLSVRGAEEDKVRALDAGADDYVTKPFAAAELRARVRACLRRTGQQATTERRFAGLELDIARHRAVRDGVELRLTPIEFAILEVLCAHAGSPVSWRQLVARVWDGAPATSQETVRVHVGSLRRKLETDPGVPRFLVTEPWVGYRFIAEPAASG
jgi:two-component system KDP operon response regulator KdpE